MLKINKLFLLIAFLCFGMIACDVDKTQEGEMPEVDVDIDTEAGELPEYDVDWADLDVGTKTKTVKVPKVRVVMEEEEVEVPYLDFNMPNDDEKEEQTLRVEAEIEGEMQELEIQEAYVVGNRMYVISTLEPTGEELGEERVRVSDQIFVNAPDLVVRHYIIGEKPAGDFNNEYRYIGSRDDIAADLQNGKQVYVAD